MTSEDAKLYLYEHNIPQLLEVKLHYLWISYITSNGYYREMIKLIIIGPREILIKFRV